jgi:hypothetical protein
MTKHMNLWNILQSTGSVWKKKRVLFFFLSFFLSFLLHLFANNAGTTLLQEWRGQPINTSVGFVAVLPTINVLMAGQNDFATTLVELPACIGIRSSNKFYFLWHVIMIRGWSWEIVRFPFSALLLAISVVSICDVGLLLASVGEGAFPSMLASQTQGKSLKNVYAPSFELEYASTKIHSWGCCH